MFTECNKNLDPPPPPQNSRLFGPFLYFLNFELNVTKAGISIQKLPYNRFFIYYKVRQNTALFAEHGQRNI